jgi:hypothetical protein
VNVNRNWIYALAGAVAIGALAWVDPIFIPLVLVGPVVTGFVVGWRGGAWRYPAAAWFLGGVAMLVSDAVVNHEDKGFHAALSVVMVVLVSVAWGVARRLRRPSLALG